MARKAHVVRGTGLDATRHARPRGRAVQVHAPPRWRVASVDAWQGHTGPRGRPGGRHMARRELAFEGPTCLWALVIGLGR